MPKTKVAITKQYTITIVAFQQTHDLFHEFIKRFFHTEHRKMFGEEKIEIKTI